MKRTLDGVSAKADVRRILAEELAERAELTSANFRANAIACGGIVLTLCGLTLAILWS